MKAGVCTRDMTFPELIGNPSVHDRLFAKVLVLDDGEETLCIICLDTVGPFFPEVRERIHGQLGIKHTLINCSHTHADARDSRDEGWERRMEELIFSAAEEAYASRVDVSLRVGRGSAQVGYNRRLADENGVVVMAFNKEGAVVPWVNTLSAYTEDGRPFAVLFEHAAHPVITMTSGDISADFPGHAANHITEELGGGITALFAQGCGANNNGFPVSFSIKSGWHERAEEAGRKLGRGVLEAMLNSTEIKTDRLRVKSTRVTLPTQELPSMELWRESCERFRILSLHEYRRQEPLLQSIKEMIERGEWSPSEVQFDINAVMIGTEWCLITLPSEIFCEYELWVDENAPFDHNMTFGYTNEGPGYIATDKELALGEKGGYEAGCFPSLWANPVNRPLAVGMETIIKDGIASLWTD